MNFAAEEAVQDGAQGEFTLAERGKAVIYVLRGMQLVGNEV